MKNVFFNLGARFTTRKRHDTSTGKVIIAVDSKLGLSVCAVTAAADSTQKICQVCVKSLSEWTVYSNHGSNTSAKSV